MRKQFETMFSPEPPPEEASQAAAEIISTGRMFRYDYTDSINSPVAQFEKEFSSAIGMKYALGVNSCGSALQLALLGSGANQGDAVLVPGFTFTAVTSAIVNCGCKPILVDIEDDYCIDISDLERKYSPGVRFLLLSYMRGRVARLDSILEFCDLKGIIIIEDCAHSLGSSWRGRATGTFGAVSCFSFHDKLLSSGEGGVLTTNDEQLFMRAVVMSGTYENLWERHTSHPPTINPYQGHVSQFSMRMSAVTAAILRPQVPLIEEFVEKYRANHALFIKLLSSCKYIRIPKSDESSSMVNNTLQFEIIGMDESQICKAVEEIVNAGIPLARFGLRERNDRCVWNWHYLGAGVNQSIPNCTRILRNTCDLRIRRNMTDDIISEVCKVILSALHAAITVLDFRKPTTLPTLS